jgi:very-short-patch-repair endonuclease
LKHFIEFAERGARALGEFVAGSIGDFDSPFEKAVCSALAERGWQMHPQVGVSAFRVDLGVVDPDAPGRYLAGVECDGATYHRSATARDRDKLREQVLRGLGWEIIRIWSTDWWVDMPGTLDKVDAKLRRLLNAKREAEMAAAESAAVIVEQVIVAAKADENVKVSVEPKPSESSPAIPTVVVEDAQETVALYARASSVVTTTSPDVFVEVDLAATDHVAEPDLFFAGSYDRRLLGMITTVVEAEGPVRDEVLARRIARAHGWMRTGARILNRVVELTVKHFETETESVGLFIWPKRLTEKSAITFRSPVVGTARQVDEVSLAELKVLANRFRDQGHDEEEALIAMSRELGLLRARATSRERLMEAWRAEI